MLGEAISLYSFISLAGREIEISTSQLLDETGIERGSLHASDRQGARPRIGGKLSLDWNARITTDASRCEALVTKRAVWTFQYVNLDRGLYRVRFDLRAET